MPILHEEPGQPHVENIAAAKWQSGGKPGKPPGYWRMTGKSTSGATCRRNSDFEFFV
jgi:hypothetical protein